MSAKSLFADSGAGVLFLERRQFHIEPYEVAELWTDTTPFTTLLGQLPVKYPDDPLFKMFEHRSGWPNQYMVLGSAVTVTDNDSDSNAITVTSATGLSSAVDDSFLGLQLEVWDTTLTTKRGVAVVSAVGAGAFTSGTIDLKLLGRTAFTTVSGDVAYVIGNVRGEGSEAGEAFADELKVVYNSTQFFSVPVDITGKLYKASLRGYNDELARLRNEKGKEFKMQREKAFLRGSSVILTGMDDTAMPADTHRTNTAGQKLRTTMGLIPIIEKYGATSGDNQNRFEIVENNYSYKNFVDDAEKWFQYEQSQGELFAFCGRGAMSYWSKLDGTAYFAGQSGWKVQLSDSKRNSLGFNIRMLETPHGILHLVPTKALSGPYYKDMVIVNHQNIFHAVYEKPEFLNNIKTDNNYNGVKDVYNSDEGIGVTLQETHTHIRIK